MARSYKKHAWCGDKKGKIKKRIANHHVRAWLKRHLDINLAPHDYKKIHCSWDICDYGWNRTWEEYWSSCQKWHQEALERGWGAYKELDEKKEYRYWYKHYRAK